MIRHIGPLLRIVPVVCVIFWCGCSDRIDYKGQFEGIAPVDPQQIMDDLTGSPWKWAWYSAALCGSGEHSWVFSPNGTVEHVQNSDTYGEGDGAGCTLETTVEQGTFSIGETGSIHIEVDGEEKYVWQAKVFETMPNRTYVDDEFQYSELTNKLTTHAYVPSPDNPLVLTQYIKEPAQGYSQESTTQLTFHNEPVAGGDCRATVSITTRATAGDEPDTEASDVFEIRCRAEATNSEGWLAIYLLEEIEPGERPERTDAAYFLFVRRLDYSRAGLTFFYNTGADRVLVHSYADCCDSRWMSER